MGRSAYLRLAQQTEKLSALDKVHDHVEVLGVLERSPERDQEWVLDLLQHATFVIGVLDLLHLDHLGFLEHLDGIEALIVLGLDEMDTTEASGSQSALDCKIGEGVFALGDTDLRLRSGSLLGLVRARRGHAAVGRLGRLLLAELLALLRAVVGLVGVGWVYQVLYAGHIVLRGLLVGLRRRLGSCVGLVAGGVHRVCGLGRGRGWLLCRLRSLLLGVVVRRRLLPAEVEAAGVGLGVSAGGRRRLSGGRGGRVEIAGPRRVLRPLLLEESESRHTSGGFARGPSLARGSTRGDNRRRSAAAEACAEGYSDDNGDNGGDGGGGGGGGSSAGDKQLGGLEGLHGRTGP